MQYTIIALIAATALCGSTAKADIGIGTGFGMGFGKRIIKTLELTPDQIEQLKEIKTKHKEALAPARERVVKARQELMEAMANPQKGDEYKKVLAERFAKLQPLAADLNRERFQVALEIREILTPEQIAKVKNLPGLKALRRIFGREKHEE